MSRESRFDLPRPVGSLGPTLAFGIPGLDLGGILSEDGPVRWPIPDPFSAMKLEKYFDEDSARTFNGGRYWLFLIDDGEEALAASCAVSETEDTPTYIAVARTDPTASTWDDSPTWHELFTMEDVEGHADWTYYHPNMGAGNPFTGITDRWHIYAHGYHWIACTLVGPSVDKGGADEGFGLALIRFTMDPETGEPSGREEWLVRNTQDRSDFYDDLVSSGKFRIINPTVNFFMTEHPDGVAIGIHQIALTPSDVETDSSGTSTYTPANDEGHTIMVVGTDGTVISEISFPSSGTTGYGHGNAASAVQHLGGWSVLAPECFSHGNHHDRRGGWIQSLLRNAGVYHTRPSRDLL